MAVKSSGSLSITTDIVGEFGGQAPHSLSEYYRNGANVPDAGANSNIATSGEISFSDFYGSVAELGVTISANTTNLNLLAAIEAVYGTQSASSVYRVSIASGVTIGATSGAPNNAAITWGDFPNGSTITLVNDGSIDALGGSAGSSGAGDTTHVGGSAGGSGGSGGDAIYANYSNQTMNITNNGNIRGGGGGGGGAGGGGKGGDGRVTTTGPGPYGPSQYSISAAPIYYVANSAAFAGDKLNPATPARTRWYWDGTNLGTSPYNDTYQVFGSYAYSRGPFQVNISFTGSTDYYSIKRKNLNATITTDYDGGNGGSGGSGGVGQGYNQTNTNGSAGVNGSTGPSAAGDGGAGGTGGNGGAYGVAGSTGNNGGTGINGSPALAPNGSSGGSGGTAGSAGRYLVKGSNTVTVTGSGTTAGGTA
jgi:hypothetical protein